MEAELSCSAVHLRTWISISGPCDLPGQLSDLTSKFWSTNCPSHLISLSWLTHADFFFTTSKGFVHFRPQKPDQSFVISRLDHLLAHLPLCRIPPHRYSRVQGIPVAAAWDLMHPCSLIKLKVDLHLPTLKHLLPQHCTALALIGPTISQDTTKLCTEALSLSCTQVVKELSLAVD